MKVTFLGTGTSTGNPEIGCNCEVCTSKDPRDWRLRASVLVETDGKRLLIDCGPDFRMQMLTHSITKLDGVLVTHEHYDHVGGLDDLRPFCRDKGVDIYAEDNVAEAIVTRMPYAFREFKYPGVPNLELIRITENPFDAAGVWVIPIRVMHGKLPILGFRIGGFAYLTDLKYISDEEVMKLQGLDVLVIDALRKGHHP
ncbi:MAG: MBL fold metallo-hydrolase, partial [Parabacteroides sp.]|nr:MBL fold metallo-hydrolase [Parabacteroides sp.]